ncbi:porphobilinogen deaminase [Halalkaliarchaeum desulfuricum]|uniref:Hydroxymethylbilane synthase n=1 Tax=Halalkaliarchaeum desulfuricum TaxID=2055893 RepID=A0A343TF45_9EURY|nr:hydroxymethylbilane synthase [Halalkaliarchaeum desulfuricum]AUX07717.1 porphobilinogen deaminase [Halalkaliarchaeum desulfuricum]
MDEGTLRLATRGSVLARRQATTVRDSLSSRRLDVELVEIETRGDRITDELIHRLGRTGAFVRALDEEVLEGDVDAAIHSMKDMPTEFPGDLAVAGVPERAPAGDVLVTPDGTPFEALPDGATVGTSSLRRGAQLSNARPDLEIDPLRGNVDTRLEKLLAPSLQREHERRLNAESDEAFDEDVSFDRTTDEWFDDLTELERNALGRTVDSEYDGIVLAEAGLRRSGLFDDVETERLERSRFVPAPGQGAIAVTAADPDVIDLIRSRIDHPPTRIATTAERTVLAELGGGCIAPIGVNAILQGEYVHTRAQVSSTDGETVINDTRDLPVESHAEAAAAFADDLADRGAADLIEEARERAEEEGGDA